MINNITNEEFSRKVRVDIIKSAFKAGGNGAHVAPSLSCVEIISAIYSKIIESGNKEHFVLSKGHAGLALYSVLYEVGLISAKDFDSFEVNGGLFPGQPSKNLSKFIEFSSGSLGMGLSYGLGLAVSAKENVYIVVGDGELNEGAIWEAVMFAGYQKLKNVKVIVDFNGMQADGFCEDILGFDAGSMWQACGWDVVECDGHEANNLSKELAKPRAKPLVIFARTTKGKGISFMENDVKWHHSVLTEKQMKEALAELE